MKTWIAAAMLFGALPAVTGAQRLGAPPATLETTYKTEHEWAVGATAADIAEMGAAYRKVRVEPEPPPAVLPWDPASPELRSFTSRQFRLPPPGPLPRRRIVDQYGSLAHLSAAAIVRSSAAVSAALRQDMADYRTHESAAMVLAAFGLRESADDLTDVRWVLNRMTAHLAVAEFGRTPGASVTPATPDGELARVAFLALSNRIASGLAALDAIADRPNDPAFAAWRRALRWRLTHDWRGGAVPADGLRIEKLEYFRARRKTLNTVRAGQELTDLKEPAAADFARIVQSRAFGVEDGRQIVEPTLGAELAELAEVYRLMHQRDLPSSLPASIVNARAGRLMTADGPQVVPWGAWAEFFQRHIGMYIGEIDRFYRDMLGLPSGADELKAKADALFSDWMLFPVASTKRTKGRGTEADLRYINRAIDLAYAAPELVNYDYWGFLSTGANYEPVSRGMPSRTAWFVPATPAVPYEAGLRARDGLGRIALPALEALVAEATSDVSLQARALQPRPNNQALVSTIVAWFKTRAQFDLYAIDAVTDWARTLDEQMAWREQGCALSVQQCLSLASLLVWAGNDARAVVEYERAFRNPALDNVRMSNTSRWLVDYYERSGQLERAYDLAQRSAAAYSATGLVTLAQLYERRGRLDEAERLYMDVNLRYQRTTADLAGFLYRQAVVAGRSAYLERWRAVETGLFPNGLRKVPDTMREQPAKGVSVYEDSSTSRRVRLQAGDIIVGVDGFVVEDKEQYEAIVAFSMAGVRHKLTAWRGVLFTVELPENHGMVLEDHPLRGWIK